MEVQLGNPSPGTLDKTDTLMTTIGTDPTKTPPRPIPIKDKNERATKSTNEIQNENGTIPKTTIQTMIPYKPMENINNYVVLSSANPLCYKKAHNTAHLCPVPRYRLIIYEEFTI